MTNSPLDAPEKHSILCDPETNFETKPAYVVGIGASAGGLESLEKLFRPMPPDIGMVFVVVQHLSPDFKSMMPELLARSTALKIVTAVDGVLIIAQVQQTASNKCVVDDQR